MFTVNVQNISSNRRKKNVLRTIFSYLMFKTLLTRTYAINLPALFKYLNQETQRNLGEKSTKTDEQAILKLS